MLSSVLIPVVKYLTKFVTQHLQTDRKVGSSIQTELIKINFRIFVANISTLCLLIRIECLFAVSHTHTHTQKVRKHTFFRESM